MLACVFLAVTFLLLNLGHQFPIPGTHWNWSGKFISIAFCLLVLACSPWLRQNAGLRWRQAPGSLRCSLVSFFFCAVAGIAFGMKAAPSPFSWETLAFQTLMPALDEELGVRGIALALLERAFRQDAMSCRSRYGWASFLTSVLFGLAHAVVITAGSLRILPIPFMATFTFASAVALVRTRSGSLVWPMLCHSVLDGLLFLVPMIR